MGMDVYGRKYQIKDENGDWTSPEGSDGKPGKYFRANVWSWKPIYHLCRKLCYDILDQETLEGMSCNGGAGAKDQETCNKMANRFILWMEHNVNGYVIEIESDLRCTPDGRFVSSEEQSLVETVSPYEVDDDHLKEWVAFLQDCGGFEVW